MIHERRQGDDGQIARFDLTAVSSRYVLEPKLCVLEPDLDYLAEEALPWFGDAFAVGLEDPVAPPALPLGIWWPGLDFYGL